jgi:DNA-directed RNA polymerase subunit RPC12/RpoP
MILPDIIVANVPVALIPPWPKYQNPMLYRCTKCEVEDVYEDYPDDMGVMCGRCGGMMHKVKESWVNSVEARGW